MKKQLAVAGSLVAAIALAFATPASSQAPAAKPKAPLATPEKPESSEPPTQARTRSRRGLDARECLKYPTNMEIHRCSLKYR